MNIQYTPRITTPKSFLEAIEQVLEDHDERMRIFSGEKAKVNQVRVMKNLETFAKKFERALIDIHGGYVNE